MVTKLFGYVKAYLYENKKQCINIAIFVTLLTLIGIAFYPSFKTALSNPQALKMKLDALGNWKYVLFIIINLLKVIIPILPGEIVEFSAGFCFGSILGCLLCVISNAIASILIYLAFHKINQKFIYLFINEKQLEQMTKLSHRSHLFIVLFIIYLIPGTPKDALNYFMPLTKIRLIPIIIITSIARIPSVISSTIAGAALCKGNTRLTIMIYIVCGLISLIGLYAYNRYMQKHELSAK